MSSGGQGKNNNVEMHGQSQGATILSKNTLQQQEREQLLKQSNKDAIEYTGIQDDDNDLDYLQEDSHRVDGGVKKSATEGA